MKQWKANMSFGAFTAKSQLPDMKMAVHLAMSSLARFLGESASRRPNVQMFFFSCIVQWTSPHMCLHPLFSQLDGEATLKINCGIPEVSLTCLDFYKCLLVQFSGDRASYPRAWSSNEFALFQALHLRWAQDSVQVSDKATFKLASSIDDKCHPLKHF